MERYPVSWIRRLNVKVAIFPKEVYKFSEIPIKISVAFFSEIGKSILNS